MLAGPVQSPEPKGRFPDAGITLDDEGGGCARHTAQKVCDSLLSAWRLTARTAIRPPVTSQLTPAKSGRLAAAQTPDSGGNAVDLSSHHDK